MPANDIITIILIIILIMMMIIIITYTALYHVQVYELPALYIMNNNKVL